MKVFKFGGASVRSAEGVKNLAGIVERESGDLFIIVSAMGKTTNALEKIVEHLINGDRAAALSGFETLRECHGEIVSGLFGNGQFPEKTDVFFSELHQLVKSAEPETEDYDVWYDSIVSYGELISTSIISAYLAFAGMPNRWLDMRTCFITDRRHRDGNVDMERSAPLFKSFVLANNWESGNGRIFVGQGFIGGTLEGMPVTLGREGSDYSGAVAANILDAESLTIWKDVEGILNADPKIFPETTLIPELTYLDAIELAYSGAQIIHPKTIKPLQNKDIPLYVRSFCAPESKGSVIHGEMDGKINIPILILKKGQVLLSIRPNDFSFVLEERLADIFTLLEQHRIKINLIQSSAVNLSLSIDRSRRLDKVVGELKKDNFRVVYNENLELLTIRGYDEDTLSKYQDAGDVLLFQRTRKIARIVRKEC